ncbi:MAG: histidine triad nucleotide-binding protein [Proteobacteria bacterium]|nr:histidine triad nucleotide-binding protein [Pseudomonadota bacterium]
MSYDANNIFARILRGEIPSKKLYENEHAFAFHDIRPLAPVHVLVIPKGPYVSATDFAEQASPAEQAGLFKAIGEVVRLTGVGPGGYRLLVNNGADANQEVAHLHFHVVGGRPLGRMLAKAD